MSSRLTLQGVSLHFGGVTVLRDVNFTVEPGQVFGLVGPNGAGKTSLFNCISGHYRPSAGSIRIDDQEVRGIAPARMVRHGFARTFQHPALQLKETVLENVLLGAHSRLPGGPLAWSLRMPHIRKAERALRDEAVETLESNGLGWAADRRADELSHGLHKGIELCRALMMKPTLLLLDEPAAGLSYSEVEQFSETIRRLQRETSVTVLIVEHNMGLISALTDRVVVLDNGAKILEGTAAEAQTDPAVVEAFIGTGEADATA